jgi:hypothetical protein
LRPKTKKRMFRKINSKNMKSYSGILKHCNGYKVEQKIRDFIENSAKFDRN